MTKNVPLKQPFITALHRVDAIQAVKVKVILNNGIFGIGSCTPNEKVTGDTLTSCRQILQEVICPALRGQSFENWEELLKKLKETIQGNTPAKAAVEIALYDARRKWFQVSLCQLLGGKPRPVMTDYTISIGQPEAMIAQAKKMVSEGFTDLKIKLGRQPLKEEISTVEAISDAVGSNIDLRLDINQDWTVKKTMIAIDQWHQADLNIAFIEQPLPAQDLAGMSFLTAHSCFPIMADESVFSFADAAKLLQMHACDYLNIKLMKTGGLSEAEKINALAELYGVKTMVGCMIESVESIAAAVAFAAAHHNVGFVDLDSIFMADQDPELINYVTLKRNEIHLKA